MKGLVIRDYTVKGPLPIYTRQSELYLGAFIRDDVLA